MKHPIKIRSTAIEQIKSIIIFANQLTMMLESKYTH